MGIGIGIGIQYGKVLGVTFSAEALAYKSGVISAGGTISDDRLALMDLHIFSPLVASGDFALLDRLAVLANESVIPAKVDLKNFVVVVPTNAPTFTADRGYQGDGVSSYIDTLFNIGNTAFSGVNYSQNSASYGIFQNVAAGSVSQRWIGASFNNEINLPAGSGFASGCNSVNSSNTSGAWSNSARSMKSAKRVLSTEFNRYIDGSLSANIPTNNSSTIPLASRATRKIALLAWDNDGSLIAFNSGRISAWFIGGGGINHANVYTALNNYLTAIGA